MTEKPAKLYFHYEGVNGERWTQTATLPPTFRLGTKGAKRKVQILSYREVRREMKRKNPPETVYIVLEQSGAWRTVHPKADIRSLFKIKL